MSKPKVLILDDEPEIGSLLKLFLEDDFDICTFIDPRAACAEIEKHYYDLVVSDIKMPFVNGLEVVRHTKKVSAGTEIVLITGHMQSEADRRGATDLGAAGILFKPFGDPAKISVYLNEVIRISKERQTAHAPAVEAKNTKAKILVLDDEVDLVDVVKMLLEDHYDVVPFTDPHTALAAAQTGQFQCFMTDLNMPTMRGKDVVASLKKFAPKIPIIIMSGHSEGDVEVIEAISLGACALLTKPFPATSELLSIIGKYVK